MKKRHRMVWGAAILLIFALRTAPVWAENTGACLECHSQSVFRDRQAAIRVSLLEETGSVYQIKIHPCPGLRSLAEENFFTASRILRLQEILKELEKTGWATGSLQQNLHRNAEAFSSLKAEATRSSSRFSQETMALRSRLQKIYDRASQMREETGRRWLIGVGSLVLLALLVLVGIGYGKMNRIGKLLWVVGLAVGCFTLNACSSERGETTKKSPAQEQVDRSLSVARQVSGQVEDGFHRSVLLAQMARHWASIDRQEAERTFELAWKIASQAQEKSENLERLEPIVSRWPEPSAAASEKVNWDSVLDLRDQLRQFRGRTWALRVVAEEWLKVDPVRGRQALERALQEAASGKDAEIRDRELRAIAETWARVDRQVAWEVSRSIQGFLLRSMALKEVGRAFKNGETKDEVYAEAWQAAAKIEAPEEKLYTMIRIAAAAASVSRGNKKTWAQRVWDQIDQEKNLQLRSWVIRDLVQVWRPIDRVQAERWLDGIPLDFPDPRVYALLALSQGGKAPEEKRLALLQKALAETMNVSDPFEKEKLNRLVIEAISRLEPEKGMALIPRLSHAYDRSRILTQIACQEGAKDKALGLAVTGKIPLEAFRQKAIVEAIDRWVDQERDQFRQLGHEALQAAASISDPYERVFQLIKIGKTGETGDRRTTSESFAMARKSLGEISSAWKKAAASQELAKNWERVHPEKAAKLLREIDPVVMRLRNFLAEIRRWAAVDPELTRKIAEGIPAVFPLEKAQALREAALALKKTRKDAAWECLETSLDLIFPLPSEGTGRIKFLGEVIGEMARMDGERTFRVLEKIQPGNMRDMLLGEAIQAWIKEKSPEALQRALVSAYRISRSSLRLTVLRRIADAAPKALAAIQSNPSISPALAGISFWGMGRLQGKKEEVEALPFFEKARNCFAQVKGGREQSLLMSALGADWARIDEEKALQVIERGSQPFAEPYSYGLLQVASQLMRWNRKEAQQIFEKAMVAGNKITDSSLRIWRKGEIGEQWWKIDEKKGKELLAAAREEAERLLPRGSRKNEMLEEILSVWCNWEPQSSLAIVASVSDPQVRATVLTAARRIESKKIAETGKMLEEVLQFAQKEQNLHLQGKVAAVWYALDSARGSEIVRGIPSPEVRSETWKSIAMRGRRVPREEASRLLSLAFQDAKKIEEETQKLLVLKNIAQDWAKIEPDQAQKIYRQTYRMAEEAFAINLF